MESQEKHLGRNGRYHDDHAQSKLSNLLTKLVIALSVIGMVACVVYGAMFIFSLYSFTNEIPKTPETFKIANNMLPEAYVPPVETTQVEVPPPPAPSTAMNSNAIEQAEPVRPEPEAYVEVDETAEIEEEIPPSFEELKKDLRALKQALPNNRLLITELSEEELDAMAATADEQQNLQELIDQDSATAEERNRYYDLMAKRFEDEKELINYCSQVVVNSQSNGEAPNLVCAQAARAGEKRLKEIDDELEKLRKDLL